MTIHSLLRFLCLVLAGAMLVVAPPSSAQIPKKADKAAEKPEPVKTIDHNAATPTAARTDVGSKVV